MLAILLPPVSSAGAETLIWGSKGTGPGQFLNPFDLALAPNGDILVLDSMESGPRIQRFSADGAYLSQIGQAGTDPGEYERPFRLAVSPAGDVYVKDYPISGGASILRYSAAGAPLGQWGLPGMSGIAVAPGGDVYAISEREVFRYEADGDYLDSWGGSGTTPGKLAEPTDLVISPSGLVHVLDTGWGDIFGGVPRVLVFSPTGTLVDEWVVSIPGDPVKPRPQYLTLGPGGDLYMYDGQEIRIDRFTTAGQFVTKLLLPSAVNDMASMYWGNVAGSSRFVYIVQVGLQRIYRFDMLAPEPKLAAAAEVLTGSEARFDATASTTPLGRIVRYQWDLDGDGSFELNTSTNPVVTHSYATRGPVNVSVKVTGDLGGSAVATHQLKILPAPPPGPVGVSIENGAQYVNDPNVKVTMRWPRYASDLLISNDGGFFPFSQRQVEKTVKWKLRASGPERLPKTIYVRFQGGESGPETYQDDVILDQTDPLLKSVTAETGDGSAGAARAGRGGATLKIVASDRTSGVRKMQVTARKAKPGKWKPFRPRVKVGGGKVFVRVRDGAGNASRWRSAMAKG